MTEPPYSEENNQRPKYMDELQINWFGAPIFSKNVYVVYTNSSAEKLQKLQDQPGVIDFPNIDNDNLTVLPQARREKNKRITEVLGMAKEKGTKVVDFINACANSERETGFRKQDIFVIENG